MAQRDERRWFERLAGNQPPRGTHSPAYSPSGEQIVFVSDRAGHTNLWIIAADGSRSLQLTNDEAADMPPDWPVAVSTRRRSGS
jgi:Tol biopolymer transport system component